MNRGQLLTNQLHDIDWGVHEMQVVCTCVYMYVFWGDNALGLTVLPKNGILLGFWEALEKTIYMDMHAE